MANTSANTVTTDEYTGERGIERVYVDWGELVDYEEGDWDENDPSMLEAGNVPRSLEAAQRERGRRKSKS
jgi:hypothetical protein